MVPSSAHHEHMKLGYNMIREGLIGDIERVDVWSPGKNPVESPVCNEVPVPPDFDFDRWTGPAPMRPYCPDRVTNNSSWFNYDYSIGFLAGWGAHPLDILVWILKERYPEHIHVREQVSSGLPVVCIIIFFPGMLPVNIKMAGGTFREYDVALNGVLNHREIKETNGTTFYGTKGWISLSRSSAQSNIPEINTETEQFSKKQRGLD